MPNDYFQFKQFTVFHDKCSMKVNTDGVLLGAWADVTATGRALDVGTGSGLIALMIAQRTAALVDAVEIDQDACLQAIENAKRSPWNDRICMYRDSFQHFASTSNNRYDLIVSNPPYFRNALRPRDKRKSNARHDTGLSFEELLHGASSLLTGEGKLCVILPMSESETFIGLARIYSMYCYRIAAAKTTSVASFSRALMAFNRNLSSGCSRTEFTIDRGEGQYSYEYIEMTKDFYLNR